MEYLIDFSFSAFDLSNDIISQLDFGPFARLERFSLSGSVTLLTCIFGSMWNHLKEANITTDIGGEWRRLRKCLQLLIDNSGRRLSTSRLFAPDDTYGHLSHLSSILQPLTQVRNLGVVSITIPCVLTDDDIAVFARAWPNLRRIGINPWPFPSEFSITRAGFRALLELATGCPHLEHIEIILDLNDPPSIAEIPAINHNLVGFCLQHIASDDEEHLQMIAIIIYRLFPRIFTDHYPYSEYNNWVKVLRHVENLRNNEPISIHPHHTTPGCKPLSSCFRHP